MSSEQYQRTVNSLDKEIADLEKKKAAKDREVANLQGKINTLKKSINSHTSASTLNSKMRQIAIHESDQAKKVRIVLISERRLPKNERSVLKLI